MTFSSSSRKTILASKFNMSVAEDTSNNSVDVKEDRQVDGEADELDDDYFVDPTRYIFYRYSLLYVFYPCFS